MKPRKRKQTTYIDLPKSSTSGLPLSLIIQAEKLTTSVSCKIYPSLAAWVKRKGGSPFLRKLITEAKQHEENEE